MPKLPGGQMPVDFYQNTDGMMPIYANPLIPKTAGRRIKNVNLSKPIGGFTSRNGYVRDNSTAQVASAICTGIFDAGYSSGTRYLVGTCGTKIGVRQVGVASWTDKTGLLTITAGQNNQFCFAMLNDIVVCCNDVDTVIQVDSTQTAAVLAGSPSFTSALFCVEYRGYMFYGNTVETGTRQPDKIWFSNNGAPNAFTDLTVAQSILVHKKQGGQLRGAIVYKDQLLLFKEQGIYSISFQPTQVDSSGNKFPFIQNPIPLCPGVGAQSHRTLVRFTTPSTHEQPGEYIGFVDQFGMPRIFPGNYQWGSGSFQTIKVGYPISNCRDTTVMSLAKMDRSVAGLRAQFAINYPELNQVWFFMAQNSQMDVVWVLDYTTKWAWTYHQFNIAFTCGALVQYSDGTYRPFTGDRNGFTCRHDTGTSDNSTAISWLYETGDVYEKSTSIRCNWPFYELRGTTVSPNQQISVKFIPDGNDVTATAQQITLSPTQPIWGTPLTWGQFNWAKGGTANRTLNPQADAKTMRVQLSDVSGAQATVEGWSIAPVPEGVVYE